ncbi:MAG: hypothetical protein RL757_3091 [Bacteroidota bacterium]|jgi:SpoVK/Ycf46/Vps4 family AAA+-type ATPase
MFEHFLPDGKNYKYRDTKVYASTEWLAENRKKYRQVFDRHEVQYMYAEVSLYNKMFDIDDWEMDVELRCFIVKKGKNQICSLPFRRKVSKHDHVVFIREGWGSNKEGSFWKKGEYYWEIYIDGEKIATKHFFIEEAGAPVTFTENPYIELQSIRLYEGPYDDVPEPDRVYYRGFSSEETRYVYAEVILRNLNPTRAWQSEITIKFQNDACELKGQIIRLGKVEKKEEFLTLTAGWGSNVKGSWREDRYKCQVIFMDRLVVEVPFEVTELFEEGLVEPVFSTTQTLLPNDEDNDDSTFDDLMLKLDALIGLREIKQKVRDHALYLKYVQMRRDFGYDEKETLNVHSVFMGNPGTGKTSVAKMMGKLYKKMGLLSRGHVHEVDRVDLVGEYIGQTAPRVKEAIEKARGGVLFIDEAYALARSQEDTKDFGREVVEILVKEMSNGAGDLAVIAAGYPKEMEQFLASNPGLKSRFKHIFHFSDYLPQELSQIADYACLEKEVVFSPTAKKRLDELIVEAFRGRDKTFGNARFVFDLVEQSKINLGIRLLSTDTPETITRDELAVIQFSDVEKLQIKHRRELPMIPIDEPLLHVSLDELNRLIGMTKVKEQIREMVALVRYYRESGKDVLGSFSLHTVFLGNPGTGKTTVARILAKIYKALGILERGHMIETDRQGLVAGYVGQTAIKTTTRIEEAIGGVLFIDEAYALASYGGAGRGDFGDEAIQTILKQMEDRRGAFFVFVAGYTDNMESFMKTNPGLSSRFDKTLRFEDYSPEELMQIARQMFYDKRMQISPESEEYLRNYLTFIHQYRDKYFGNARTIRQIVDEAIKKYDLRLAAAPVELRTDPEHNVLRMEDLEAFKMDKNDPTFSRRGIGFQSRG